MTLHPTSRWNVMTCKNGEQVVADRRTGRKNVQAVSPREILVHGMGNDQGLVRLCSHDLLDLLVERFQILCKSAGVIVPKSARAQVQPSWVRQVRANLLRIVGWVGVTHDILIHVV